MLFTLLDNSVGEIVVWSTAEAVSALSTISAIIIKSGKLSLISKIDRSALLTLR